LGAPPACTQGKQTEDLETALISVGVFWLVAAELVHTQDKIIKSFPEVASVWGHGNRLSSSRIARNHSQYRMHALEGT